MKTRIYIDKGEPFVSAWPEPLTDGSEVWNLNFRNGDVIHCVSERAAEVAMTLIAAGLEKAAGERPLIL